MDSGFSRAAAFLGISTRELYNLGMALDGLNVLLEVGGPILRHSGAWFHIRHGMLDGRRPIDVIKEDGAAGVAAVVDVLRDLDKDGWT